MTLDGDLTTRVVDHIHKDTGLSIDVVRTVIASLGTMPSPDLEDSASVAKNTKVPLRLPEFNVKLMRVRDGDSLESPELGQRTKFGGSPNRIQGGAPWPTCPHYHTELSFVAQIDSIEHQCKQNPHSVDSGSSDQKWMFGDVGMIYVYYCFDCGHTEAERACY